MKKNTTTIEINGKSYDAQTGEKIADVLKPALTAGRSTDGMLTAGSPRITPPPIAVAAAPSLSPKLPVMDIRGTASKTVSGRSPQPATTLMRHAVSKPLKNQPLFKTQSVNPQTGLQSPVLAPKLSIQQIDSTRLQKATKVSRSQLVSHFRADSPEESVSTTALTPPPATHNVAPTAATPPLTLRPPARSTQPGMDIFEKAIAQATAHEQPRLPSPRVNREKRLAGRLATIAGGVLILVAIGGFLVYKNTPNISLYMASAKAGFQASVPRHQPVGYTIGSLTSSAGTVAVNYRSPSNAHAFSIIEKSSDWDSLTLRDSFVIPTVGQDFQTLQTGGQTIFVYGQHNATWVSGNVWYRVQTDGTLDDQQLSELASTL